MEIDEAKMVNWLDFFNIDYDFEIKNKQKTFVRRHVSGHASGPELKELIERVNPAKIIPIHTEHLELFEAMYKGKIVLVKYAQPIEIIVKVPFKISYLFWVGNSYFTETNLLFLM